MEGFCLGVKTCELFLCFGAIVFPFFVIYCFEVFCFFCFTSLVRFSGFYTEDEPSEGDLTRRV